VINGAGDFDVFGSKAQIRAFSISTADCGRRSSAVEGRGRLGSTYSENGVVIGGMHFAHKRKDGCATD
jgi:hypothetical protein